MRTEAEAGNSPVAALRRPQARRPWLQLVSAVLELAGGKAELLRHAERPWASVTFSGTRHTLALAFNGAGAVAAGEAFIIALPEHEFAISRQLVADAAVTSVEHDTRPGPRMIVEAEVLLLEDV
ncbi:MAG: hypothetical protein H6917_10140 [Novosphingobium sp.]|nr:hypothetical protein [Novosphingobium sp.]MCP5402730.1 hypothetical protein [Novosphingobium sp.]